MYSNEEDKIMYDNFFLMGRIYKESEVTAMCNAPHLSSRI